MNKRIKQMMTVFGVCLCLTGCGKEKETEIVTGEMVMETADQTAAAQEQTDTAEFFPESYTEQTERVKFACNLEVPEAFDAFNFHIPAVKGRSYLDKEKIYANYVEGNVIREEHHDSQIYEGAGEVDIYIFEDDSMVGMDGGIIYYTPAAGVYDAVLKENEVNAPKDQFSFGSGETCVEQVREELGAVGCPVEEYEFEWFSVSGEDHAALEQQAVETGRIDSQSMKQDGWTEADNTYTIYAWQIYEGLQVLPQWMTTAMSRAFLTYQKAPVYATCGETGILGMSLIEPPYILEGSTEPAEFLAFPEIADTVVQKYENLLEDDALHTVTRARLVLRTALDETQQMIAEPVWYFEVTDGSKQEVVLVNAVTGNEIFLY